MTSPRYQEIKAKEIPVVKDDDGTEVRIISGNFWGRKGPVDRIEAQPAYLDVWVPPGKRKSLQVEVSSHAFAYVFLWRRGFSLRFRTPGDAHRKHWRNRSSE